ncbi:MAG: hypothetical protein COV67_10120 [Nitrospinae bacterium CG11_big_fil_rev_8_21_14_0_20_56_8]|nr:MAG: hypothetical protein COV67_10120 [Nitrospinae bacterium CG11_big_fil_rev_8_21_14_0_20_56_8]
MQIEGIHHIALNVKDLDRAEAFYTQVLGFKVAQRFSGGLRHLMLDAGNFAIALFETPDLDLKQPLETLSESGYMHLAFKMDKRHFSSLVENLEAKNISIDEGPVRRGNGRSIYFNDPDYNHLEIRCDD